MNKITVVILAMLLCAIGCSTVSSKAPSPRASALLKVMEDANASGVERANAAYELSKVADAACVDRLIALLPGDWDAMTFQIVGILGDLGDTRALPILEKMYKEREQPVELPGKINAAVDRAITKLRAK